MVIGITVAAALVSVGVALNMHNNYTATARILPPQQGQSSATAMLGQLGSFAGAAGGALDIKDPNDLYIGMMKSRTLTDNLEGCRHNAAEHLVYASRSKALFRFAKAILAGEPIQTFNHANEPCRYRAHETRT